MHGLCRCLLFFAMLQDVSRPLRRPGERQTLDG